MRDNVSIMRAGWGASMILYGWGSVYTGAPSSGWGAAKIPPTNLTTACGPTLPPTKGVSHALQRRGEQRTASERATPESSVYGMRSEETRKTKRETTAEIATRPTQRRPAERTVVATKRGE